MAARGIVLGTEPMSLEELLEVVDGARVRLGAAARARMTVARSILLAAVDRGEPVYGTTRRLGAGAGDAVDDQAAFQLQVLRNHDGALGPALEPEVVRAAMAARLAHLVLGGSGARPQVAEGLAALLDAGVVPVVRERGSVGMADLALLAAVGRVLVGEGSAWADGDRVIPAAEALAAAGLAPLELDAGEALAIINTNAFALGAAALAVPQAEAVSVAADRVAALSLEAAGAHRPSGDPRPWGATANAPFEPAGQWRSAAMLTGHLSGSFLLDPDRVRSVPDELSFRVAPPVHGAFADLVEALASRVDDALAVSPENPLVDVESREVVPTANFADPLLVVAAESLRAAAAQLGGLSERRIAVLSRLARPLRAAGAAGIPGLLAYTAAETAAVLRRRAAPLLAEPVLLSEVEDAATWAWPAVRALGDSIDDALQLLAIEALHAASLLRAAPERERLGVGTGVLAEALIAAIDAAEAGSAGPTDADALVLATIGLLVAD